MELNWIDVHTHLDKLTPSVSDVLDSALAKGVDKFITIGTCPEDHQIVLDLAQTYKPNVYCTLGVHPHDAHKWNEDVREFIKKNDNDRLVALGEMGLDYFYNNNPKQVQLEAFEQQLELAAEMNLPVEIHTRDAEDDTILLLNKFKSKVRGLIHCFTGSQNLANKALDYGFNISISGIVTFKKATDLQNVVKSLPIDRIHVETDAPYLSPVPMRGKENTSAYVVHTAEYVSQLLGINLETLSKQTNENARKLFPRLV